MFYFGRLPGRGAIVLHFAWDSSCTRLPECQPQVNIDWALILRIIGRSFFSDIQSQRVGKEDLVIVCLLSNPCHIASDNIYTVRYNLIHFSEFKLGSVTSELYQHTHWAGVICIPFKDLLLSRNCQTVTVAKGGETSLSPLNLTSNIQP